MSIFRSIPILFGLCAGACRWDSDLKLMLTTTAGASLQSPPSNQKQLRKQRRRQCQGRSKKLRYAHR